MVNTKENVSIDFSQVTARIASFYGCEPTEKAVAKRFGLSSQDYNNRKRRGTLLALVVEWALSNGVSVDWLLTGKDPESRASPGPGQALIRLPRGETEPLSEHHADLLEKALVILRAQGDAAHFAASLETMLDSSLRGVRLANEQSGSPGEMAKRYKKGA